MSKLITTELLDQKARIVAAPATPTDVDRTFEMPPVLYATTVGMYLAFVAVMCVGLATPGLIIPMVIFALFIVAGFGLPAIWTQLAPAGGKQAMSYGTFARKGVMTLTGRLPARDAAIQMLLLPTIVACWGVVMVTIIALA